MKKFIQIYTGGAAGRNITCEEIEKRLAGFGKNIPDGIIVGWSLEKHIYSWLRAYTKDKDIELYLWFQVLSEYKELKNFYPVREIGGGLLKSVLFDKDEEFSFYCPSNGQTIRYLKEIYEEHFADIGFDGVFLDRIRFPSPTFDRNAIFSCCCADCLSKYEKYGITGKDIEEVRKDISRHAAETEFLGIEEYKDGIYTFRNKELNQYFNARARLITELAAELSGYFKSEGLKIGLDLFAPCLSLFVGQSYQELSSYADYIKPMLYRYTDTPAGMLFELKGITKALSREDTGAARFRYLTDKIGIHKAALSDFMAKEMDSAKKLSHCKVYAGMEIHTIPGRMKIKPAQITEGVKLLDRAGAEGRIASWNIMVSDKENIAAFMGGVEDEA